MADSGNKENREKINLRFWDPNSWAFVVVMFIATIMALNFLPGILGRDMEDDEIHALFFFTFLGGVGFYFVKDGFDRLKEKRVIEDIPTSKIATGAVGTNVEVIGKIPFNKKTILTAPISKKKCVFYSVEIFKHYIKPGDQDPEWHLIDRFGSSKAFYFTDASGGYAAVFADGAELRNKRPAKTMHVSRNDPYTLKPSLKKALQQNKDQFKKFDLSEMDSISMLSNDYQFQESYFVLHEPLYILGYAESGMELKSSELPGPIPVQDKPGFKWFQKAKRMIGADSKLRERFDLNHDGKLSIDEMEKGTQVLASELSAEKMVHDKLITSTGVNMVFKKNSKAERYIITNEGEKSLTASLGLSAEGMIIGGAALAIWGVWGLISILF